jgi:hypothetical protein
MKSQFIARKLMAQASDKPVESEPKALQSLAVETIAQNFELYPMLDQINNPIIVDNIYAAIDLNRISIITLAKAIENENFWKRACKETFAFSENNMIQLRRNPDNSGYTFKQKFFELYFQRLLKNKDLTVEFFTELCKVAGSFVKSFVIEEVPSSIGDSVFEALSMMPNLETLRCTFVSSCQDYSYDGHFARGLDASRAKLIKKYARFQNLKSIILENNDLTSQILKTLLKALVGCKKLREIRVGHNKLANEGIKVLSEFLTRQNDLTIEKLDISDNEIEHPGAKHLMDWVTKEGCPLIELNLKANYLNNNAFTRILDQLLACESSNLKHLNLAANLIGDDCGETICNFVLKNKQLDTLLLDANEIQIGHGCFNIIQEAFSGTIMLKQLSLRRNQIDEEMLNALQRIDSSTILN